MHYPTDKRDITYTALYKLWSTDWNIKLCDSKDH